MDNKFIKLIKEGKIRNIEELKKAYRKIAKKTHPDAVGSNQYIHEFIKFKDQFDEAKQFLNSYNAPIEEYKIIQEENYRYLFYQEMQKLYSLEALFFQEKTKTDEQIKKANQSAFNYFIKWKEEYIDLYLSARNEYEKIRKEKRKNTISEIRKPLLYFNLRPIFFNLFKYHITGLQYYKKQLRNLNQVMLRLEENKFNALKEYLLLLIKDMENGPALFG